MAIFSFTQIKGGNGTTTLSANLAELWPNPDRILMEMGVGGGNLGWTMGYDLAAPSAPTSLTEDGYDLVPEDGPPRRLSEIDKKDWQLPVLPAPMIPDFPPPGEKMWWQKRAELATQTEMDVICDLGVCVPEHLTIHNRVLNASISVIAVAASSEEAKVAVKRLAKYRDSLAVVIISKYKSTPAEITGLVGCPCFAVLPRNDAIAESAWRNVLASDKSKQGREYLTAVAALAHRLRGE